MKTIIALLAVASLVSCRTSSAENASVAKDLTDLPSKLTCANADTGYILTLKFGGRQPHDADFSAQLSKGLLISELMYGFSDNDGGSYLRVFSSGDGLVSVAERGTLKIIKTQTVPSTTTALLTTLDGTATTYGPCVKTIDADSIQSSK